VGAVSTSLDPAQRAPGDGKGIAVVELKPGTCNRELSIIRIAADEYLWAGLAIL